MRSRRRAIGIALVVALASAVCVACSSSRAARPTAGTSVIAFGDSLVAGKGASAGHDFVSLLSKRLGVRIVNAGRNGDTTGSALERLDRDVLSRSPRVVVVLLGGNDFLRRVPRDQTFKNLAAIVDRIRERGAAVVLVGVSVGVVGDPYAAGYEEIAQKASAGLVPDILDDIIGDQALMADAIHPNDRGYEIMADRLEPILRDLVED